MRYVKLCKSADRAHSPESVMLRPHALPWTALVLISALAAQPLLAQDAAALTPAERTKVDAVFKEYDKDTSPGCALGVFRDGQPAYTQGYGMADLERKVRIHPATLFDIASSSKQFTTAAVILLAHDGKLALSDDVRKYIPELPQYGTAITLDHLMHHTSGLRDYLGLFSLAGYMYEGVTTDAQALKILSRQRQLNFPTGSRHEYSNSGYLLLSIVVQRVSGKSLGEFARARLFEPLGMRTARVRDSYAMLIPDRALGYVPDEQGGFKNAIANWVQTGDGGLQLSVEEVLKWMGNYDRPSVGGPGFVEQMEQTGTLTNGEAISYARGLFVDQYRGVRRVHHPGAWIGYRATLTRFPQQRAGIAVFCNAEGINPAGLADQVADIVLAPAFTEGESAAGDSKDPATPKPGVKSLPHQRLAGDYFDSVSNTIYRIADNGGALTLKLGSASIPLAASDATTFAVTGAPVTVKFHVEGAAAARALSLQISKQPEIRAERFTAARPAVDKLREYAGCYRSPELDVSWPITVKDGALTLALDHEGRSEVTIAGPLEPAMTDAFSGTGGLIQFRRDAAGQVNGFDVSGASMRDIHFEPQAPACAQ